MSDRGTSRRRFLGAGAVGAGAAALGGLTLDAAGADGGSTSSSSGPDATADPTVGVSSLAPPTIPGTLTKTFMFADPQGFSSTTTPSPLVWNSGSYQPGGGFVDLPLGLDAGATIRRVDVYVRRTTTGSASIRVNRASVVASASGAELVTITTASGTGILTGGTAMSVKLGPGEQVYLESNDFGTSACTFVGVIVTYEPATVPAVAPPVNPPALASRVLALRASKGSVVKGRKVTLSGSLTSTVPACLASQTVLLERATKGSAYKPAGSLTTDANGAISTTQKVKKKTRYRMSVAATTTCSAAQSSAVTVKVKASKPPK